MNPPLRNDILLNSIIISITLPILYRYNAIFNCKYNIILDYYRCTLLYETI